jgi:hypothetical protein
MYSLNFAKNNSKVVSLIEGQTEFVGDPFTAEPRTRTVSHQRNSRLSIWYDYGSNSKERPRNRILVYDADGSPITDGSYQIIGKGVPDFYRRIKQLFTYKNINLSFLIDFKSGGDIYSGTNVRMTQAGFTKQTLLGRAGEAPLTINGVVQDGLLPMAIRYISR